MFSSAFSRSDFVVAGFCSFSVVSFRLILFTVVWFHRLFYLHFGCL